MKKFDLKTQFVLDAQYDRGSRAIRLWMPGGEMRTVAIPRDDALRRLPEALPFMRKLAIAYGFKKPSSPLRMLSFDIETYVQGVSPNPDRDVVKSLSTWRDDGARCYLGGEREIVEKFLAEVASYDPDVLAHFFGNRYDMLVVMAACARAGIPCPLGRDGSEPRVVMRPNFGGDRFRIKTVAVQGRLSFDAFDEAIYDQSLNGIKGRGLKEIAKWMGLRNVIEEDGGSVSALPKEDMAFYNLSDARITYIIAKAYLENITSLAEMFDLPISLVVERRPSHVGDYIYGKHFLASGGPYGGDNATRFQWVFNRAGKAYQGAYVDLFRAGLFAPVRKIDFSSMYPGIMAGYNLDESTMRTAVLGPTTGEPFRFTDAGMEFDDKILGRLRVDVDTSSESFTRGYITKLLRMKADLKGKTGPAYSQYWVVKLVLNCLYGYHGLSFANWGYAPIAITICAVGRWYLMTLSRDKYPDISLEADTDGLYLDTDRDDIHLEAQEFLRSLVPDRYAKEFLKVDLDRYEGAIICDEKNYVLKNGGRIEFRGSGFKGRGLPRICDGALKDLAEKLFDGVPPRQAIERVDLRGLPMKDFVISAQMGKDPQDYDDSTMYADLAKKLAAAGIPCAEGDTVRYVKTEGEGYMPVACVRDFRPDEAYYRGRIASVVARLVAPMDEELRKKKEIVKLLGGT